MLTTTRAALSILDPTATLCFPRRRRYFANHNMSDTVITLLVTYHEQRAEVNLIYYRSLCWENFLNEVR